nr:hypothetical protein BaRGS_008773 [Batillaria attramentaria]
MRTELERVNGTVFELRKENETLSSELAGCKKRMETMETEVREAKFEAGVAHTRSDDVEQYTRRNNIRIFGIAESDKENVRDCETKVLKLLHDKLSLRHIQASDLEAVHRVGPARGRQRRRDRRGQGLRAGLSPRAIIVRFVSRRVLHDVFVSRRKLKNSGVVIAEDLTTARYQLLKKCKDHPCVDQAWSKNGKIYVKIEGNQSGEEVKSQRDLQKLLELHERLQRVQNYAASIVLLVEKKLKAAQELSENFETDNEENVLVCIRIILELHKQFRPQMNEEIQDFLQFVKGIYSSLPSHLPKIFEPRPQRKVKDMTEINVELWLQDIYTLTPVVTDKKNADGQNITVHIL